MNKKIRVLLLLNTFITALAVSSITQAQERQMNVTQGPDLVFHTELDEIFAQMKEAVPSNKNGRVGNEMVFWSYQLSDGNEVNFFACAVMDGVDCADRIQAACPAGVAELIVSKIVPGTISDRQCKAVATVEIGDVRPGCIEKEATRDILAGILQCP